MNGNDKKRYAEFLRLVKDRHSVRKFTAEPVSSEEIDMILEAARYAMSGGNSQPWEFIIITDMEKKRQLRAVYERDEFRWTYWLERQRQPEYRHPVFNFEPDEIEQRASRASAVFLAPVLIALVYDPRRQFGSVLSARAEMADGSRSVISCTMGHISMLIHLAVASLGLGSCRVDCNQQQGYRQLLELPEPLQLYCFVPVGHEDPSGSLARKERHSAAALTHRETYDVCRLMKDDEVLQYIASVHLR
ncbi:MAG: nitroreductase family protein [Solobacterium sp.]|nr:nitroreductase family protein [Solobacterium sp.]